MSSALDKKAAAIVAEMIDLGAVFTITDVGPTGEQRWCWRPEPELMRNAIRKVWLAVEDRAAPGFHAAMLRAIRNREAGGARAV